jgi:hypothetical protein
LNTDGLLIIRDITVAMSLITEFKDDVELGKRTYQERVLAQVIFYLHDIQSHIEAGNLLHLELPNVVLAADVNQAFVVNARVSYDYLSLDIDWSRPAREAYDKQLPKELFDKLHEDKNINPYIYDTTVKDFDLNDVLGLVADLASTENDEDLRKIAVNQANVRGVYDEFLLLVMQDKAQVKSNQELVAMFVSALIKHDKLTLRNNEVILMREDNTYKSYRVNGRNWYAFFSRFDTNYNVQEIKNITEVADVLLEETNRRKSGEYWTPTAWAVEAVNEIAKTLGDDWRQKYVVWDASAGSKNLTRDFKFKKLFSSTLFENELDLGENYNRNNHAFQYDFLNDDPDLSPDTIANSKLMSAAPELATARLNNEQLVFYMNPPYGTAGDLRMDKANKKSGIAKTAINEQMKLDGMKQASENLYSQFFWRAVEIKKTFRLSKVALAYFTNSQYMAGGSYFGNLAQKIFSNFEFKSGFLLNSGEFRDTASNWGISFVVMTGIPETDHIPSSFTLDVKALEPGRGILTIQTHTIENLQKSDFLSEWVRAATPGSGNGAWLDKDTYPTFSSAFSVKQTGANSSRMAAKGLGYAWNKGNNVEKAATETALFSGAFRDGHGFPIVAQNFERVMLNFAIRKATKHSWLTDKDNYHKPSDSFVGTNEYNQLVADSVVYGLFNQFSYQVSLADVEYKGMYYHLDNQFFWLSKADMSALAAKSKYVGMEFDINDEEDERFVYKWLKDHENLMSSTSKELIKLSKLIISDTFDERERLNYDFPQFNFMRWDAGWKQIRRLITNGRDNSLYQQNFKPLYEQLERRINVAIYEYGFLTK